MKFKFNGKKFLFQNLRENEGVGGGELLPWKG